MSLSGGIPEGGTKWSESKEERDAADGCSTKELYWSWLSEYVYRLRERRVGDGIPVIKRHVIVIVFRSVSSIES